MHYSFLLATALAAGSLARPHDNINNREELAGQVDAAVVTPAVLPHQHAGVLGRAITNFPFWWWDPPNTPAAGPTAAAVTPIPRVSSTPRRISSTPRRTSSSPRRTPTPSRGPSSSPRRTPTPTPARSSTPRPSPSASRSSSANSQPSQPAGNTHISGPSQASLVSGQEYQNAILYHHNARRQNHNAGPLTWCTECEQNARKAGERCDFNHYIPAGVRQGQNLYTTSGNVFNVTAAITESWYKSEFPFMAGNYGKADIDDATFHKVGHMTQVVWKGTTGVGCVSIDCTGKMTINGQASRLDKYTVCNYSPPGNVEGQYASNVASPNSNTNLGSWTD